MTSAELQGRARRRSSAAGLAMRSRIVLAAADGGSNTELSQRLGLAIGTIQRWRNRFAEMRCDGSLDEPRPGRPRVVGDERINRKIDAEVPADLDVRLVLDNASTHKTPSVKRWLTAHRRFVVHFTPTGSSWLNLVERWFAELTTKKLRRRTHTSVRQLNTDIRARIDTWNDNPRPHVWTKTADQILASIGNYCTRINDAEH
jgi:transposase